MFFSNLLILGVAVTVAVVEGRVIGDVMTKSSIPQQQQATCAFHPHAHLRTSSYTNIPLHAWPHISQLLLSHSPSSFPISRNSVQTLRLSEITNDVTLESVVLGLVFTASEGNGRLELRDGGKMSEEVVGKEDGQGREKICVEEAVRGVKVGRMVEGVLNVGEGRGKMGFLVYRVD